MRSRPAWFAVPILVAALLAVTRIGDEPLYGDELASIRFASQPLGDLVDTVLHDEANMGPYYLGLHAWMLVGESATWVRVPSVLGGLCAIALLMELAHRWFGEPIGWLAGLLLAVHPMFLDYLTEARSYTWAMASVLAATLAIDTDADRVRPISYGLATGAGMALNLVNAAFIPAHAVALLCTRATKAAWRGLAAGVGLSLVVFAPFAVAVVQRRSSQVEWISRLRPVSFLAAVKDLSGGRLLVVVIGGVTAAVLLHCWRQGRLRSDRRVALLIASIGVPILGLAVVSLLTPLFVDRYLIGVVPFLVLCMAHAIQLWSERVAWASDRSHALRLGGAFAVLVFIAGGWAPTADRPRPNDPAGAASYLAAHAQPGEVVHVGYSWDLENLLYYDDLEGLELVVSPTPLPGADWFVGVSSLAGAGARCFGNLCVGRARD